MGSKKSSSGKQTYNYSAASQAPVAPTVQAPTTDVVTPTVARELGQETNQAQQNQSLARTRLSGIRSTWANFGGGSSKFGS